MSIYQLSYDVLLHISKFMCVKDTYNLIATCKKFYGHKKRFNIEYGYKAIDFNSMKYIINNEDHKNNIKITTTNTSKYNTHAMHTLLKYNIRYYFYDFMQDPHSTILSQKFNKDEVNIIYQYILCCLKKYNLHVDHYGCTKKINIMSVIFRLSPFCVIELLFPCHYHGGFHKRQKNVHVFYYNQYTQLLDTYVMHNHIQQNNNNRLIWSIPIGLLVTSIIGKIIYTYK